MKRRIKFLLFAKIVRPQDANIAPPRLFIIAFSLTLLVAGGPKNVVAASPSASREKNRIVYLDLPCPGSLASGKSRMKVNMTAYSIPICPAE